MHSTTIPSTCVGEMFVIDLLSNAKQPDNVMTKPKLQLSSRDEARTGEESVKAALHVSARDIANIKEDVHMTI